MRLTSTDRYRFFSDFFFSFSPYFLPVYLTPFLIEQVPNMNVASTKPSSAEITTNRNEKHEATDDLESSEDVIIKKRRRIESAVNPKSPSPHVKIHRSIDMTRESSHSPSDVASTGVPSSGYEVTDGGTAHGLKSKEELTAQETMGSTPAANDVMSPSPHVKTRKTGPMWLVSRPNFRATWPATWYHCLLGAF